MKKTKQPMHEPAPATETFGGDYHKCESTFQPGTSPTVPIDAGKRKRLIPVQNKRKDSRVYGS